MPPNPNSQRKRTKSRYGTQLEEKQNLKGIYGIRDHQLKIYYAKALKSRDETANKMVILLEKRLDNAIYRIGLAATRKQARQMVSHGLFVVNDHPVDVPSFQIKTGDVVTVKPNKRGKSYFTNFDKRMQNAQIPSWLALDTQEFGFKVTGEPTFEEANIGVAVQDVVEFLAR